MDSLIFYYLVLQFTKHQWSLDMRWILVTKYKPLVLLKIKSVIIFLPNLVFSLKFVFLHYKLFFFFNSKRLEFVGYTDCNLKIRGKITNSMPLLFITILG